MNLFFVVVYVVIILYVSVCCYFFGKIDGRNEAFDTMEKEMGHGKINKRTSNKK